MLWPTSERLQWELFGNCDGEFQDGLLAADLGRTEPEVIYIIVGILQKINHEYS